MNDLVSIIVPIYNVEKYLDRCIITIVNQSYKNLEIILVDDGSPDNCSEICDSWAEKDNRIIVIHKENGGLSDARNTGINIANGDYLAFIDSDDYVHADYIKVLYELCKKYDSDISVCSNYKVTGIEDYRKSIPIGNDFASKAEDFLFKKKKFYCVAWGKLYKREIFNDIRYPKGRIHEDVAVVYKVLYNACTIAVTDLKLYYYYVNPESIMRSEYSIKHLDILDNMYDSYKYFINKREEKIAYIVLKDYIDTILSEYKNIYNSEINSRVLRKQLINKYKAEYKKVIKESDLDLARRFKYRIYRYCPILYLVFSK